MWQSAERPDDVPVPDGLADRLAAAVAARESLPDGDAISVPPADVEPAPQRARATRRHWLVWPAGVAAGLLVTSAIVMLALWLAPWTDDLTAAQVAEASREWIGQFDQEAWRTTGLPDAEFPRDPSVRLTVVGWQPCTALPGPGRPWCTAPICRRIMRPPGCS